MKDLLQGVLSCYLSHAIRGCYLAIKVGRHVDFWGWPVVFADRSSAGSLRRQLLGPIGCCLHPRYRKRAPNQYLDVEDLEEVPLPTIIFSRAYESLGGGTINSYHQWRVWAIL